MIAAQLSLFRCRTPQHLSPAIRTAPASNVTARRLQPPVTLRIPPPACARMSCTSLRPAPAPPMRLPSGSSVPR